MLILFSDMKDIFSLVARIRFILRLECNGTSPNDLGIVLERSMTADEICCIYLYARLVRINT